MLLFLENRNSKWSSELSQKARDLGSCIFYWTQYIQWVRCTFDRLLLAILNVVMVNRWIIWKTKSHCLSDISILFSECLFSKHQVLKRWKIFLLLNQILFWTCGVYSTIDEKGMGRLFLRGPMILFLLCSGCRATGSFLSYTPLW